MARHVQHVVGATHDVEVPVLVEVASVPGQVVTVERGSTFDGYYLTGDGGYFDEDGYLYVMGRTDDVLNVAGHRLSTGSLEAALAGHPSVAECAVIGVADELKGQVPRALVVLKAGVDVSGDGAVEALQAELVQRVRDEVGALASLHLVDVVVALPKTRSGKMLRKTMRQIADGGSPAVPSTIEDASVLEVLRPVLTRGLITAAGPS